MDKITVSTKDLNEIVTKAVKSVLSEIEKKEIEKEWKEKHEELRNRLIEARDDNEKVMNRYYGITTNPYRPILIEKVTLDRILNKHGDNGYVIVSANRSDLSQDRNDEKTRQLINDINQSGYSYLPVYGGYRNTENGVEDSYEPSFIIFNYTTNGQKLNFTNLEKFAIAICEKYDQHSVLIKSPSLPPVWKNKSGVVVSKQSSNKAWKNDPTKEYFTSMIPKDKVNPNKISRRFSLDIECYTNPIPCNLNEERQRKGEIMLWRI